MFVTRALYFFFLAGVFAVITSAEEAIQDGPSPLPAPLPHELPFESGKWEGQHYSTHKQDGNGTVDDIEVTLKWRYLNKTTGILTVKSSFGRFPLSDGRHRFSIERDTDHVFHLGKRTIEISDSPIRNRQCVIITESDRDGYYCLYSPFK
jgi:hypothetical protein